MIVLYSLSCHLVDPYVCCSSTCCPRKSMPARPTRTATKNVPYSRHRANNGPRTPPRRKGMFQPVLVQDTPVSHKQAGSYPYTSTCFPAASDRNVELRKEVNGYVVGPMPVQTFLEKYVPKPKKRFNFRAKEAQTVRKQFAGMTKEKPMYSQWIGWMQKYVDKYQFADVHGADLAQLCGRGIRPDMVLRKESLETKQTGGTHQLHNVELIGEFKCDQSYDPFVDNNPKTMCSDNERGRATLGQLASYATCHMGMQCRTHVFQFLVIKGYARLLRWDRSGVIVTKKIDLKDSLFAEFFWRFSHLGHEERGWDSTVSNPLDEEMDEAKPALDAAESKLGKSPEETPSHYVKVTLGNDKKRAYIVHRLFYSGLHSPFGRATRGYAAYSLEEKKVVFLKSTWRVDGRKLEHETLEKLRKSGVQHIPTVFDYWDVDLPGHETQTQKAAEFSEWRKEDLKHLRTLKHYILVLNELGRELTTFRSSKELLIALGDAAEAHEQADGNANILHRDISSGNIIITEEGRGLLIDWDLAKDRDDVTEEELQGEPQPERTGTYQFMAARFVTDNPHLDSEPHNRLDDIESMFHLLQWIILRYADHGMPPKALGVVLQEYFDLGVQRPGTVPSCAGRRDRIQNDLAWTQLRRLHPLLRDLLKGIRRIIATRYVDPDELQQMPVQLGLRNDLDERGWLAATLRRAADDPVCPTTDASSPRIVPEKREVSKITPSVLECRCSYGEPPQKKRRIQQDGIDQRNPPKVAETKIVGKITAMAHVLNDIGEGSSCQAQRRQSANRRRGNTNKRRWVGT